MKTIYWAVKLDEASSGKLLDKFPAQHENVYAEHMTIVFNPSSSVDAALMSRCGEEVSLDVVGHLADTKGQAVAVQSPNVARIGGGVPHVTISCSPGTKPVYSNELLKNSWDAVETITLTGRVARFTRSGWDFCD